MVGADRQPGGLSSSDPGPGVSGTPTQPSPASAAPRPGASPGFIEEVEETIRKNIDPNTGLTSPGFAETVRNSVDPNTGLGSPGFRGEVAEAMVAADERVIERIRSDYGTKWPVDRDFDRDLNAAAKRFQHEHHFLGAVEDELLLLADARFRDRWRTNVCLFAAGALTAGIMAGLYLFTVLIPLNVLTGAVFVVGVIVAVTGVVLQRSQIGASRKIGSTQTRWLPVSTRRARNRLADAMADRLLPALTAYANSRLRVNPSVVRVLSASGLSGVIDESFEVSTRTAERLRSTMSSMHGASIGLAGPRGAGKSTLMNAVVKGRFRGRNQPLKPLGTVVSAPVRYQSQDFIAHLFAKLCYAVRDDDIFFDPEPGRPRQAVLWSLFAVVLWVASSIVYHGHSLGLAHTSARVFVTYGLAVAGCAAFLWGVVVAMPPLVIRFFRQPFSNPSSRDMHPSVLARRHLHELRNLDTVSRTMSGKLGPANLNVAASRAVSSARQAMSAPDLVSEYQRFVDVLASPEQPVIIGIDELDKMASEEDARQFLSDIKTVFGQAHCYYLVSVSVDALSAFERRGMPFRDVFDSSFDTVLRVEPLTAEESVSLLRRRVVGFGTGALLACYTLSGGLPRDLIRTARDFANQAGSLETTLTDVLWPVILNRVCAAQDAVDTVAARSVDTDGTQPVLQWLAGLGPLASRGREGLREGLQKRWRATNVLNELATSGLPFEEREHLGLVCLQFATFCYFADTVLETFDALSDEQLQALERLVVPLESAGSAETVAAPEEDAPQADDGPAGAQHATKDAEDATTAAEDTPIAAAAVEPKHDVDAENPDLKRITALADARRQMMLASALAWTTVSNQRSDREDFPKASVPPAAPSRGADGPAENGGGAGNGGGGPAVRVDVLSALDGEG